MRIVKADYLFHTDKKKKRGENMVCEMLGTTDIAKVVGCTPKKLRKKIENGELPCARIRVINGRRRCNATISGLAKGLEISREEVIRRIEEG